MLLTRPVIRSLLILLAASLAATGLAGCVDESWSSGLGLQDQPIVGGRPENGHPAVVALMSQEGFFCTGTLVRPTIVVTAAHCLEGGGTNGLSVYFGPDATRPHSGVVIPAAGALMHPRYDSFDVSNDIAVVTLSRPADVTPIDVQTAGMGGDWVGRSALFVGFGTTNPAFDQGGVKFAVNIPITEVDATTFAYSSPGANTCFGDSGGPAFATDANGQLRLIGVTSWGDEYCAEFGVNTRVDAFASFLAPYLDGQAAPGPGEPAPSEPSDPFPGEPSGEDFCADEGWYGDGYCDEDCPNPDPDCGGEGGGEDPWEIPTDWPADMGCAVGGGGSASTGLLIALSLLPLLVVRRRR